MRQYFNPNQPLNNDQLLKVCPSIFATQPMDGVSDKYQFIPTISVVEALRQNDWQPVKAMESRCRKESKRGFQKHILRFRQTANLGTQAVGEEFPEIVLVNSHDATTAYQLHAGLFRLVCSNGMIVANETFNRISFRHMNFDPKDVVEASYRVIEETPRIMESVNELKTIELSTEAQKAFADSALLLKYDSKEVSPISSELLLKPRRHADTKNDLWTVFNRVQENMIRGGLKDYQKAYKDGKEYKRTSEVKSINENVKLNKALWTLTESMKGILKAS